MRARAAIEGRLTGSPWHRLNLRWNPFGEPASDERSGLFVPLVDGLESWLRAPGRRAVELLGATGRGKTTHLVSLARVLPGAPYVYLAEGAKPEVPRGERLLLDEAQRLPVLRRRRLFRRVERIAVATHERLTRELEAAGLAVLTVVVAGLGPESLASIVSRRLEWARLGPGPLPELDDQGRGWLLDRFGDDLRSIIDHLYEVYQALGRVGVVRPGGVATEEAGRAEV